MVADATAAFDRAGLDGKTRPAIDVHLAALSDLSEEFTMIILTEDFVGQSGKFSAAAP